MNYAKIVLNGTFFLEYSKVDNISANIFLSSKYKKFIETFDVPVTNDIPVVYYNDVSIQPEIGCYSNDGFSVFNASSENTILQNNYTPANWFDSEYCFNQFKEKSKLIYNIIKQIISKNEGAFSICGMAVKFVIPSDDYDGCKSSIDYLFNNFFKLNTDYVLADSSFAFCLIKDGYHVNYKFTHMIGNNDDGEVTSGPCLAVEIDINDKIKTNFDDNYICSEKNIDKMIEILIDAYNSIDKLIDEKVVDLK